MTILNCFKMVLPFENEQLKSMLMWWQAAMGTRVQLAMGVNIGTIEVLWHFPLGLIWRFKTLLLFDRVLTKTLGKIKFWSDSRLLFSLDERSLSITCLCPLHVYFYLFDLSPHGRALVRLWGLTWGTPLVHFVGRARVLHTTQRNSVESSSPQMSGWWRLRWESGSFEPCCRNTLTLKCPRGLDLSFACTK